MSFPADFALRFTREAWSLYGVGAAILMTRLVHRSVKHGGLVSSWQADEWVALGLLFWYTLLTVSFWKIVNGGGSNFMIDEWTPDLTAEVVATKVTGSKWVLVSEESMTVTIWSCKVMMSCVYRRLTFGLEQERWIKGIAAWVLVGFVAVQISIFAQCRPFSGYWSVPAINPLCWSYYDYSIVFAVCNISADILTLGVGLPLIASVKRPWQQKLPLVVVFGMSLFVIAAATANKLYSLVPSLVSYDYTLWYIREAAVCVYVTNMPVLWSLVREIFPSISKWGQNSSYQARLYNPPTGVGSDKKSVSNRNLSILESQEIGVAGERQEWGKHTTHQIIVEEDNLGSLHGKAG